jgi:CRISPR-associated protein Cas2
VHRPRRVAVPAGSLAIVRWVFAYDIAQDGRRARLAAVLSMWGDRVQKSVFECTIDAEELAEILTRVDAIMNLGSDAFNGYRQCSACAEARVTLGQGEEYTEHPYWIV